MGDSNTAEFPTGVQGYPIFGTVIFSQTKNINMTQNPVKMQVLYTVPRVSIKKSPKIANKTIMQRSNCASVPIEIRKFLNQSFKKYKLYLLELS